MLRKISETLSVYPTAGIQVMNDEGKYMFSSYARKWMPDTPGVRKNIIEPAGELEPLQRFESGRGYREAINSYCEPAARSASISMVTTFHSQVEAVARYIDKINHTGKDGERLVRIHAVGFPTQFAGGADRNGTRFANLMRVV